MTESLQPQFAEVLTIIKTAQQKVLATANQELIKLYWSVGNPHSARNGMGKIIKKQVQGGDSSVGRQEKRNVKCEGEERTN